MKILITLFVIAVVMLLEGFGIWMLMGINEHEPTARGRVFWLCVITVTQWIGALAYCAYRTLRPLRRPRSPSRSSVARLKRGLQPQAGGA